MTPAVEISLVDDMVETMYAAPGIGLAAPQIGVPLRIFVVDLSVGRDASALITMINPVFVEREGLQLEEEGCLSLPGFNATVARPERAVVRGLDRDGCERQVEGTGTPRARVSARDGSSRRAACSSTGCAGIKRDLIVRRIRKLGQARALVMRIVFFGTPAFAVPTLSRRCSTPLTKSSAS